MLGLGALVVLWTAIPERGRAYLRRHTVSPGLQNHQLWNKIKMKFKKVISPVLGFSVKVIPSFLVKFAKTRTIWCFLMSTSGGNAEGQANSCLRLRWREQTHWDISWLQPWRALSPEWQQLGKTLRGYMYLGCLTWFWCMVTFLIGELLQSKRADSGKQKDETACPERDQVCSWIPSCWYN